MSAAFYSLTQPARATAFNVQRALIIEALRWARWLAEETENHRRISWRCELCSVLDSIEDACGRHAYQVALRESRIIINKRPATPVREAA